MNCSHFAHQELRDLQNPELVELLASHDHFRIIDFSTGSILRRGKYLIRIVRCQSAKFHPCEVCNHETGTPRPSLQYPVMLMFIRYLCSPYNPSIHLDTKSTLSIRLISCESPYQECDFFWQGERKDEVLRNPVVQGTWSQQLWLIDYVQGTWSQQLWLIDYIVDYSIYFRLLLWMRQLMQNRKKKPSLKLHLKLKLMLRMKYQKPLLRQKNVMKKQRNTSLQHWPHGCSRSVAHFFSPCWTTADL